MWQDDRVRIQHMLDAAREAQSFVCDRRREDLDQDRLLALGLLKSIEIIGEAAAHVSMDLRDQYPIIPWGQIIAMRNRLVHVYFDIDLDQVWKAVVEDLVPLIDQLQIVRDQIQ
jgi:uncharacterized protein with HEPN domain